MQVNYDDIIFTLKNKNLIEEEYNHIIKICNKKINEIQIIIIQIKYMS